MLIIILGLIIAVATYGWGLYRQQKEEGSLLKFLDKFDSSECVLDTNDMPYEVHMLKPLTLLAKAFEHTGEYHKSISIYLYLIKNNSNDSGNTELLERLGNTYLHAGFLERARSIYLDILRKKPRCVKVLYDLGIVYEMMHDYKKAKEVVAPLELLQEDIQSLKKFLDFSQIKADKNISTENKILKLKRILEEESALYREVVSALLKLDTYEAWKIINPEHIKEVLDILWFLPNSQLDLDIITANPKLNTLYYAKGYLQNLKHKDWKTGIFSLDVLVTAKLNGFKEAELHFSYLCNKCKQSFPISFERCPNCMAIHSIKIEESIEKASPKTDYSLF